MTNKIEEKKKADIKVMKAKVQYLWHELGQHFKMHKYRLSREMSDYCYLFLFMIVFHFKVCLDKIFLNLFGGG